MSALSKGPWEVFYVGSGDWDLVGPETQQDWMLAAAAPDLLAACKAQHVSIDILMAMLIDAKTGFMPSKSEVWPVVIAAHAAIAKATGSAA